jgi:carboxypeptidase family protein/TonB-dependent receptor-like protein
VTVAQLIFGCALCAVICSAQNAQVSGLIQDPSAAKVAGAEITVRNEETGGKRVTTSNREGYYSVFSLRPGSYRISVHATGFEAIVRDDMKLDVAEKARLDFTLRIGDSHTEVTVHGGPPLINTEDASVGTVIGRDIIDQMPLNGRGIQSLIELSPGVVVTPVVDSSRGQFAVNGQRTDANYFTVDGVSANFAAGDLTSQLVPNTSAYFTQSQSGGGMIPANNFLGTFSNLVSPDALQEFRIETSTFAPEYGRSPGAQIGLITRSGANRYAGSLFEYFRNDKTDANDWFANQQAVPKAPLRFNDFGGTVGGPVRIPHVYNGHDRTFFFLSVENLVMLQPQPVVSAPVPTLAARQNAPPLVAAVLDAYPLPTRSSNPDGSDPAVTGLLPYVGSHSLLEDQQTYGIRIDHSFSDKLTLFARYNQAPSERLLGLDTSLEHYSLGTETLTFGLTHILTPHVVNEIRLNGSRQSAVINESLDKFAGAKAPPDSVVLPPGYSSADSDVFILNVINPATVSPAVFGRDSNDLARQLQFIDNLSWSRGSHLLKFGVDYKRFFPVEGTFRAQDLIGFSGIYGPSGIYSGVVPEVDLMINQTPSTGYAVPAFSSYAQDTWRINKKLTLTYGLRWDVAPAPRVTGGQAEVLGGVSNVNNISSGYTVPFGKPFYPTSWSNVGPRLGMGWQLRDTSWGKTVLRAGVGRFFDLGQAGFEDSGAVRGATLSYVNQPLGAIGSGQPTLVQPYNTSANPTVAATPGYNVPEIYQWNVTLEQSFGQQTFSVGYVGALDRRLTRYMYSSNVVLPTTLYFAEVGDNGSSSYQAMQLRFNRRLFSRVALLLSYTWSHSIDNLSSDDEQLAIDSTVESLAEYYHPNTDRGSSDFDIRHSLNGSLIAPLPSPHGGIPAILFRNWSANSIFFARSALPTDILTNTPDFYRPDLVPGVPLYLYGSQYPGGKRYNAAAFIDPPDGAQGNLGRNVLRGFGAWQIDFALHRTFQLSERASLQFRAEAFNILNHPNFANPSDYGDPTHLTVNSDPGVGTAHETLATGLGQTSVPGGLNSLFQIGGPRSIQFALRLHF